MSTIAIPDVRASDLLTPERTREHFDLQRKPIYAVPTPLPSWSKVCCDDGGGVGIPRGWFVTVAAATGTGKSITALGRRPTWPTKLYGTASTLGSSR